MIGVVVVTALWWWVGFGHKHVRYVPQRNKSKRNGNVKLTIGVKSWGTSGRVYRASFWILNMTREEMTSKCGRPLQPSCRHDAHETCTFIKEDRCLSCNVPCSQKGECMPLTLALTQRTKARNTHKNQLYVGPWWISIHRNNSKGGNFRGKRASEIRTLLCSARKEDKIADT